MGTRHIPCTVTNEYLQGSGVVIGAAGSHDDVYLRLTFGSMWDGLSKYVTFRDALGENPTITLVTPAMAVSGQANTYDVGTPATAKAKQGRMMVVITGYAIVNGVQEDTATMTTTAYFRVLPSDWALADDGSIDATLAQQLQAEIDEIEADIHDASEAAEDAEAWAVGQIDGTDVPNTDPRYHNNSKYYAQQAGNSATSAAADAGTALQAKTDAVSAKNTAVSAKTDAVEAKNIAVSAKETAVASATNAGASERAANASAISAGANAAAASGSATSAGLSKTAAAASASDAEAWAVGERGGSPVTSEDETYENNAKYYAGAAENSATAAAGDADDAADAKDAAEDRAEDAEAWAVGQRDGSDVPSGDATYHNNSKYWAEKAQSYAEQASVPPVEGVYNIIVVDRTTDIHYAVVMDDGILCGVPVADSIDATDCTFIDGTTGDAYILGMDNGVFIIEEVTP